jgi:peptidoglycan/LPS O-acetylase OafA/YrhL
MPVTDSEVWSGKSEGHSCAPSGPGEGRPRQVSGAAETGIGARPAAGKRRDIQGLRAVAVGLVILDHLALWPHGGFIGVDVFFVISGFLITGLLVRAARSERSVASYIGYFYSRRARRILPAALGTLVACVIAADIAFNSVRAATTHTDILWALFFVANIHFANLGTDYFTQSAPPSLVQHFWSLAVEEQFYLVWPIITILVLLVIGRRRRAARTALLVVAVSATVASFAWALQESVTNPTVA